jgi:hypothetical protein
VWGWRESGWTGKTPPAAARRWAFGSSGQGVQAGTHDYRYRHLSLSLSLSLGLGRSVLPAEESQGPPLLLPPLRRHRLVAAVGVAGRRPWTCEVMSLVVAAEVCRH